MLHFQLPRLFSFEKALRTRSRHNVNLAYALHAPATIISRTTHMRRNRTGSHRHRRFPSSRVSHTRAHPHMEFPRERGPRTTFHSLGFNLTNTLAQRHIVPSQSTTRTRQESALRLTGGFFGACRNGSKNFFTNGHPTGANEKKITGRSCGSCKWLW
jgi:hypothetical protein